MDVVPRLAASLAVVARRTGRDRFRGDDVGVGGAHWIDLAPGVTFRVSDAASLDLSVRLPVRRHTQTKLSDSSAVWQIGLAWSF